MMLRGPLLREGFPSGSYIRPAASGARAELSQAARHLMISAISTRLASEILPRSAPPARTLLCIDDDPANTTLMGCIMALRPAITLLGANAGMSGVALAQECRPNLVLLDFHLPDMNGDQVLKCLLDDSRTADIPVVILSGDATPAQISRLLALGARGYITKPFNVHAFLDFVDDFLCPADE